MDSDTSDEEECVACELEKENKQPNDHQTYDYVDIRPTKSSHSRTQTMPCDKHLYYYYYYLKGKIQIN